MTYRIGGLEFDGDTTLEEMYAQLECKKAFKDFAEETFKRGTPEIEDFEIFEFPDQPYAEALVKGLQYSTTKKKEKENETAQQIINSI